MTPTPTYALDLESLFGILGQRYDLRAGTVRTPLDEREIYLSTDLIAGVHDALAFEAGEAWGLILQNCGRTWGDRLMGKLWGQLQHQAGVRPEDLQVDDFVAWVEGWFRHCGWGVLTLDLTEASRHGVVFARLEHSLYREAIPEPGARCDFLVAGLLGRWFSRIAGHDLEALELGPENGAAVFAITAGDRLIDLEEAVEDGASVGDLRERLLA